MVSRGDTLQDHLEWQLRMENLTDEEWEFAEQIIYNIQDDGYLTVKLEDIIG
jgi:RNA polymerase sigma-54 factor